MQFSICLYVATLQASLGVLPLRSRVAFAVWCADPLLREVRDYLAAKIDGRQYMALNDAVDYLWKCACGQEPVDSDLRHLEQACAQIDWAEESVAEDEQATNFYAIEAIGSLSLALDACRTGSALSSARAAESVINTLDYQLGQEYGESSSDEVFSDIRMKAELDRQQKMLNFLKNSSGLTVDQKYLFRK